jgi:hypothetical protein
LTISETKMATTAQSWESEQLRAITRWYGAPQPDPSHPRDEGRILAINPDSPLGLTLRTLQHLSESRIEPKKAAEDLASYVLTTEDSTLVWSQMIAAVCFISECLDRLALHRLADMLVELARMPHTLPKHPYDLLDDLSFAELPGLGIQLRESLNGQTKLSIETIFIVNVV